MGECDAEVGLAALRVAFLCGGEVGKSLVVGRAVQVDESAIDVAVCICRLHEMRVRYAQGGVRTVGSVRGVADHEELLSVVLAGDCPDTIELCPAREIPIDVGAVRADEVVAWVDDGNAGALFAAVSEEVLNMGACACAHIGEGEPLRAASRCTEPAEVVLLPVHVTAVGKEARLLERLCECNIGAYALVLRFLVVCAHEFLGRARELRLRVAPEEVGEHLLLGSNRLACNRDLGRIGQGHAEDVRIGGGESELQSCGKFCIDRHAKRDGGGECGAWDGGGCLCRRCVCGG